MKFSTLFASSLVLGTVIADLPSAYVETTPYSVFTTSMLANGNSMIGVIEYYRSVTYISNCDSTSKTEGVVTVTLA
ncbi:hypothetical protein Kpol_1040p1 [Vanderwaltozyma polyspora DSM 70294]|uniref:Uncharacterized protein n=1 Tax=Vanderwaltozyma polyspora (strain ATCC 22028 / DSM 70294 / BCRC 21397 / CBS 2163 / NBRC 10782 / NRRL Y-8283 / UCD 57-17) TaxID=436907 RepID=A7TPJ5_VANPO|nr:uncharacterized protein Kpol_1040p1 [Vanderwaltozyma polyspora DSM 70294]EDO15787.1 hypothetical protein Kpol_1040p1 [Vanderwaltozyma polyspora DSM 70294]